MNPRHRKTLTLRETALPATVLAALAAACVAGGAGAAEAGEWSLGAGPIGGAFLVDAALADYRWDAAPAPVWGLAARVSNEQIGVGLRVWRSGTTQSTGIPGETSAPDVNLTGTEAVGSFSVAEFARVRLVASGSVGTLHLGWSPDRLTLPPFGAGDPLEVRFDPVTEWTGGVGLTVERPLFGRLDLSLGAERSWFRLDTAHRAGTEIVTGRETFGNWMIRAQLSHRVL